MLNRTLLIGILVLITTLITSGGIPVGQTKTQKRVALVIGNSDYESSPLTNPKNDAADISSKLKQLGFDVILIINANKRTIYKAIDEFGVKLKIADIGLFFYAGHGMQINGANYIIPIGAYITNENDVELEGVDVRRILGRMEVAENDVNLIFLDACRDNPFKRSFRSTAAGLAKMDAPKGTFIAFATSPDNVASDGNGRNSPFTKHLLANISQTNLPIENLLKEVRKGVLSDTNDMQMPWQSSSLTGDFYFVEKPDDKIVQASTTTKDTVSQESDSKSTEIITNFGQSQLTDKDLRYAKILFESGKKDKAISIINEKKSNTNDENLLMEITYLEILYELVANERDELEKYIAYYPASPFLKELEAEVAKRELIRKKIQEEKQRKIEIEKAEKEKIVQSYIEKYGKPEYEDNRFLLFRNGLVVNKETLDMWGKPISIGSKESLDIIHKILNYNFLNFSDWEISKLDKLKSINNYVKQFFPMIYKEKAAKFVAFSNYGLQQTSIYGTKSEQIWQELSNAQKIWSISPKFTENFEHYVSIGESDKNNWIIPYRNESAISEGKNFSYYSKNLSGDTCVQVTMAADWKTCRKYKYTDMRCFVYLYKNEQITNNSKFLKWISVGHKDYDDNEPSQIKICYLDNTIKIRVYAGASGSVPSINWGRMKMSSKSKWWDNKEVDFEIKNNRTLNIDVQLSNEKIYISEK
ncbi:MAG: caspase family protein [Desulfobacterales bacterium]|nr:caspase family protein [Desulfobacterales bacterium]